jgi:chemotaxis response regulator CheB
MRIGIVNHTLLAAEALRRSIVHGSKHEVVWMASDGADAVARCQRDRPDVVLMDLFMPRLDGIETTRQIMAKSPCAIVIVAAQVEKHVGKVFAAMGAGALDAVEIPRFGANDKLQGTEPLLAKLEIINRLVGPLKPLRRTAAPPKAVTAGPRAQTLVVIGSSAGGPTALTTILAGLPADFPAPVVIVQHVDKQFAPGLTVWFATHSKLRVRVATEGDRLEAGQVYLAGRDRHLVMISATQLGYTSQPTQASYCPSVDVFFRSVATQWRGAAVGVLLTGMGRDGAEGLKALREAGHHTIAQDKGSSAVYGMPKAAVELNAAQEILALDKIAPRLTNIVSKYHGR